MAEGAVVTNIVISKDGSFIVRGKLLRREIGLKYNFVNSDRISFCGATVRVTHGEFGSHLDFVWCKSVKNGVSFLTNSGSDVGR